MSKKNANDSSRDAMSLRMLGSFFLLLGVLVLIGTLWSLDNLRGVVVSVASGLTLTGVGAGMQLWSRALRRDAGAPHDETVDGR
ncbi:MAG: hypothetical protein AAF961_06000 [Planctomycetota bacterium]